VVFENLKNLRELRRNSEFGDARHLLFPIALKSLACDALLILLFEIRPEGVEEGCSEIHKYSKKKR
jgi:hypothetical protein